MYALKAREKLHKREKELYSGSDPAPARPRPSRDRRQPSTTSRSAKYIGTFSIEMQPSWKNDVGKAVKHHLSKLKTKDSGNLQLPVSILINMEGVKVHSGDGSDMIMAHALRRILYCTVDTKKHLFAMVTSNPDTGPEGIYSHVFATAKKDQANEINELVGKAFKASFTKKSLRRHKQKVKDTPWKVVTPQQQPTPPPPPQPAAVDNRPIPSAPPPSAPPANLPPPLSPFPPTTPPAYNRDHLLIEAGQLEADLGRLQARIAEIQAQLGQVSGVEDAVFQLTVQLSTVHQQVELKSRRLAVVRQEIQATQATPPPSYEGLYPALNSPPPDVSRISLEDAEWFQEGLPREIAMEILSYQTEGGFIVRRSSSNPGCYALSLKAPQGIVHYLIENMQPSGFRIQGGQSILPSLVDLIHHLTVYPESLPCPLSLDTSNPNYRPGGRGTGPDSDSDLDDTDFGQPTQYHLLS